MSVWTIRAHYDPEAHVWYSIEGEVPGLLANADSIEGLVAKVGEMLPDLLDIHADDFLDKDRLKGPHRVRVLAFHEQEYDIAA